MPNICLDTSFEKSSLLTFTFNLYICTCCWETPTVSLHQRPALWPSTCDKWHMLRSTHWKSPYEIFSYTLAFGGLLWRWCWWCEWTVNKATGRHVFLQCLVWERQGMAERSSSGDCRGATVLVLAGCNSVWKVWRGKHGSWKREREAEGGRRDRDKRLQWEKARGKKNISKDVF